MALERHYSIGQNTSFGFPSTHFEGHFCDKIRNLAEVAELADALRSGRSELMLVWVRLPPSAPKLAHYWPKSCIMIIDAALVLMACPKTSAKVISEYDQF